MKKQMIQPQSPKENLDAFETYADFVEYVQTKFSLEPDEYPSLFNVLVKLESLGQDAVKVLNNCRQGQDDCMEMMRFLMYVDELDLSEIREMA